MIKTCLRIPKNIPPVSFHPKMPQDHLATISHKIAHLVPNFMPTNSLEYLSSLPPISLSYMMEFVTSIA